MNLEKATELKVGALALGVIILIVIMSLQMTEDPGFLRGSKYYWFHVPDASGLLEDSAVKMAGIDVGVIEEIQLTQGMGRITIKLRSDVKLSTNSRIEIRANGILGDKYVEVVQGELNGEILENRAQIPNVRDVGSLSSLMNEVGKIANSLGSVAKSIEDATINGDRSTPVGRIVSNLEVFTSDLAEISNSRKRKIGAIIDNTYDVTDRLARVFNDPSGEGFNTMWTNLNNTITRLDEATGEIKDITGTISSGKGTIGRLVYDESTVDNVNDTLTQVNEFFGQTSKIATDIDFHSHYLVDQGEAKNFLSLKIQPGLDRYYEIGIVDDPFGIEETEDTIVSSPPDSGGTTTRTTTLFRDKVKFNALFAKNYFDLTIKAGIIESAGGLGIEYYLYKKYLKWNFDAFDFEDTNLRTSLRWNFFKGVYVLGGVNDILDKREGQSGYLGAGLYLTNDDIKLLLSGLSL